MPRVRDAAFLVHALCNTHIECFFGSKTRLLATEVSFHIAFALIENYQKTQVALG
jgi:hypothetical protein